MKPHEQLIGIIRAALRGETYRGELDLDAVMPLAKAHQVEHIVANAMTERGDLRLSNKLYNAVWLVEQQKAIHSTAINMKL